MYSKSTRIPYCSVCSIIGTSSCHVIFCMRIKFTRADEFLSPLITAVTLPLSACVKIILGCANINLHVSDSNFNSCLSIGDVKIGEEMIFKIGIEWFVTSILLSMGILCVLRSTLFMQSKIILFLLLKESAKFFPNCKKHWML